MKKQHIIITLIILIINTLSAQENINVLFLGNSYTSVNNLPQLCKNLAESTGKSMTTASVTPSSYLLLQHAENAQTLESIRKGCWDFVVFQEQSQLPTIDFYRYKYMHLGYRLLCDSIMRYNPDTQTVGYMTWGRRYGGQQCEDYGLGLQCSADFVDFDHMQDSLTSAYFQCRELFGGLTAPVGLAWKRVLGESAIVLHSSDDSHPTIEGSYLAACVFHSIFWNESPEKLWHPESISNETASYLQKVAYEVTLDPLEIDENFNQNDNFEIYNSNDNIVIHSKTARYASVIVYDILGNKIAETEMNGIEHCEINTHINKGVVIVKICDKKNSEVVVRKIAL